MVENPRERRPPTDLENNKQMQFCIHQVKQVLRNKACKEEERKTFLLTRLICHSKRERGRERERDL